VGVAWHIQSAVREIDRVMTRATGNDLELVPVLL
jgi:hypothetical protein